MEEMKTPKYMSKRNGSQNWYMRIAVPDDLHQEFGKDDKWKSLRTPDVKEAERRMLASTFISDWKDKFALAKIGDPSDAMLDTLQRERLSRLRAAQRDIFKYAEQAGIEIDPALAYEQPHDYNTKTIVAAAENGIAKREVKRLQQAVAVGENVPENKKLIEALNHLINGTAPANHAKGEKLSKLLPRYIVKLEESRGKQIIAKNWQQIGYFIKTCGDLKCDAYTVEHGRRFYKALTSRKKPLAQNTVNQYLKRVHAMFEWLQMEYDEKIKSPVKGFKMEQNKKFIRKPRDPFTSDELRKIFSTLTEPLLLPCKVALYHGMRGGEIVGLTRSDVKEEDGILYFDVKGERIKNVHSLRKVPIHASLVKEIKALPAGQLFPDFTKGERGYKSGGDRWEDALSKRFTAHLKAVGVKNDKLTFHSFRHTFTDAYKNHGVPMEVGETILGHSVGTYGVGTALERNKKHIDWIKFDCC